MNKLIKLNKLRKLNNKGLTLTEVMVSVLIFAILMVPIVSQFNSLLKQNYNVKVSQAETDYATRVMEQFKELDADAVEIPVDSSGNAIPAADGSIKTKAGYVVDTTNPDMYVYSMNGVQLEKDVDSTATSVSRNGVTYNVKVSLDSSYYNDASGNATYNPNNTTDYNLVNIDDSNAVLIREMISNYDSRAEVELMDKYLDKLKDEDATKYNQYLNGSDVLQGLAYAKNLYVKVAENGAQYLVTVKLIYTANSYGVQVEYPIMTDKVYEASKTGNLPPSVYIFYNQYIQENSIVDGSDSITIDNSACKNKTIKCYIIKGDTESSGTYTYYVRSSSVGDQMVGTTLTKNVADSYVYKVKVNGSDMYKWPSFVTDVRDDAKYGSVPQEVTVADDGTSSMNLAEQSSIVAATTSTATTTEATTTTESTGGSTTPVATKTWYVYQDVITNVAPSASYYKECTGKGGYSYIRKEDDSLTDATGPNGALLKQGDFVYQRSDNQYVWPDGSVSSQAPDISKFYLCTPSKKEYTASAQLNLMISSGSEHTNAAGKKLVTFYTNMDKSAFRSSLFVMGATDSSSTIGVKYDGNNLVDLTNNVFSMKDDKSAGSNRLYHVILELYKNSGGTSEKILTLESGKED